MDKQILKDYICLLYTSTDGSDITKTPEDMFESPEIENNLKLVDDTIRDFYGWEKYKPKEDKQS